ncbi:MAG: type VI secretion system baseplate subunit TssF [Myxococcota bacterium]
MFSKYYQSELTYLRELGREFAAQNPGLAGPFAERGADPDVERLLEGFAFLTARIRERIDDAVPEIVEGITELLLPHYLRSIPSTAVVQFSPHATALRGRHTVTAGTELGATPIDGTSCIFRTVGDLDLLPLSLTAAKLDQAHENSPAILLKFRTTESGRMVVCDKRGFRLFLHGQLAMASSLFLWFDQHLTEVNYIGSDGKVPLGQKTIRRTALDPRQALLPWPEFAPIGTRLLQEYFTIPERMLFLDLVDLDRIPPEGPTEFEIEFRFQRPEKLPERLERDQFRLHCTPVINLFDITADPFQRDRRQHEYLLRAAGLNPLHMSIYSVNSVTGLRAARKGRREYKPFFDFGHARTGSQDAYFSTRRVRSPIDGGLDTYLSVMTPRDVSPEIDEETFSVELTCTNRLLPAELRVGDISVPTPRSPTIAKFSNLTKVTKPVRPPLGAELHWRLIGHLSLNVRSLGDPKVLRSVLHLYNYYEAADQQLGRANELRANSVRSVDMRTARRLLDNSPVRGIHSTVELEEANLAGPGDAILFGNVLDSFFADRVTINSFHQLTIQLHPSGASWTFPPRNGTDPML